MTYLFLLIIIVLCLFRFSILPMEERLKKLENFVYYDLKEEDKNEECIKNRK